MHLWTAAGGISTVVCGPVVPHQDQAREATTSRFGKAALNALPTDAGTDWSAFFLGLTAEAQRLPQIHVQALVVLRIGLSPGSAEDGAEKHLAPTARITWKMSASSRP